MHFHCLVPSASDPESGMVCRSLGNGVRKDGVCKNEVRNRLRSRLTCTDPGPKWENIAEKWILACKRGKNGKMAIFEPNFPFSGHFSHSGLKARNGVCTQATGIASNRCPYRRCGVDTEIPYRLFSVILCRGEFRRGRVSSLPQRPSRTKNTMESEFRYGEQIENFGAEVAKRNAECSEMPVF